MRFTLRSKKYKVAFESDLDAEAARGLLRADVVEHGGFPARSATGLPVNRGSFSGRPYATYE